MYVENKVAVTTIDQVAREKSIKCIYLLKNDTEGAELDVLKGAFKSLRLGVIINIQLEHHNNDVRSNDMTEITSLRSEYKHQESIKPT